MLFSPRNSALWNMAGGKKHFQQDSSGIYWGLEGTDSIIINLNSWRSTVLEWEGAGQEFLTSSREVKYGELKKEGDHLNFRQEEHPGIWFQLYSPINNEMFVGSLLVTHGANPGRLLLVHLDVESGIKTLQVGASQGPAGDGEAHFAKL